MPTTLETGRPGESIDFYHPALQTDYGTSNDLTALEASIQYSGGTQGCAPIAEQNKGATSEEDYQACAHAIPEVGKGEIVWCCLRFFFCSYVCLLSQHLQVWPTQHLRLAKLRQDNPLVAEAPIGIGVLGQQNWFIPLWTAKRNSSFAHYTGLAGEHNREILADTFKRPTTWGDYCDEVSNSSCTEPDEFATRPPASSDEAQMYHHGWDTFKGYFRKTEENNCEDFPDTCTGHFAE